MSKQTISLLSLSSLDVMSTKRSACCCCCCSLRTTGFYVSCFPLPCSLTRGLYGLFSSSPRLSCSVMQRRRRRRCPQADDNKKESSAKTQKMFPTYGQYRADDCCSLRNFSESFEIDQGIGTRPYRSTLPVYQSEDIGQCRS